MRNPTHEDRYDLPADLPEGLPSGSPLTDTSEHIPEIRVYRIIHVVFTKS